MIDVEKTHVWSNSCGPLLGDPKILAGFFLPDKNSDRRNPNDFARCSLKPLGFTSFVVFSCEWDRRLGKIHKDFKNYMPTKVGNGP